MTPTWRPAEPEAADQPVPYTLTAKADALLAAAEADAAAEPEAEA